MTTVVADAQEQVMSILSEHFNASFNPANPDDISWVARRIVQMIQEQVPGLSQRSIAGLVWNHLVPISEESSALGFAIDCAERIGKTFDVPLTSSLDD